ncbi:MAG: DUF479 domain-containing protein [Spirochaetes bacterium]|nr:DUF479 domain-containing protein [Spirochaetota bacterium]
MAGPDHFSRVGHGGQTSRGTFAPRFRPRRSGLIDATIHSKASPIPNFLTHLLLSHESDGAILGAVLADFMKGPKALEAYPPAVRRAVRLHRAIDRFTDSHPLVRHSVGRLGPRWGLYASVLIDVLYDHLLARDWEAWWPEPLTTFTGRCYAVLGRPWDLMPEGMRYFTQRMVEKDVLASYATRAGTGVALDRLSGYIKHRMGREVQLAAAVEDFYGEIQAYTAEFNAFWPELAGYAREEKGRLAAEP